MAGFVSAYALRKPLRAKIFRLRAQGMQMKEIAKLANISRKTLWNISRGYFGVSSEVIVRADAVVDRALLRF